MSSDKRSVVSAASLVSVLTLASRLLGVVRDSAIARVLGDSVFNDIFNMAFEIPNLARRVLGEGALSAFIVPIYHKEEKLGGPERAFLFFNRALSVMVVLGGLLTVAGVLLAEPIFLAFGGLKFLVVDQAQGAAWIDLGARLTRIMFPYLLALTVVSLFMGVCHAHRRFLTPALGSSAINVVIIITALAAADAPQARFTVYLAWAVMAGVVIRLALMLPTLWRLGWRPRWAPSLRDRAMSALFGKMGAATFAAALAQLTISINLILANWCGPGSVTYLRYSNRLVQFPLALMASALATAIVPAISRHYVDGAFERARDIGRFATRALMILLIPAMVGFWALGGPIVALIFERGAWDAAATANTTFALSMYAAGLLPMALGRLLVPLYYAKGDVKTPVKIGAVALVVNIITNLILMKTFLSYAGLALGAGISATVNAWLLWRYLKRDVGSLWDKRLAAVLVKCSIASVFMGAVCYGALRGWERWAPVESFTSRAFQVLALCVVGVAVYFLLAWALRLRELSEALGALRRRRGGADTPLP